jgi:transketolase
MSPVKSTREAFIRAFLELHEADSRHVLISADSVLAARALPVKEKFPEALFEGGIAEQNAVAMAAGMAAGGLYPWVITYAGFLTMRACEQIRTFIAYPGLTVRFVGLNGGLLGGEREGVTHQFFEDVGILRTLPGVAVLTPADAGQAYKAALAMSAIPGPSYLRLASGREPAVYDDDTPFTFGKARIVIDNGRDIVIFVSGYLSNRALEATEILRDKHIDAVLVDVSTCKPIDVELVSQLLKETGKAVTVEDHNIIGGLGSAVCEVAAEYAPSRITRIGLKDVFPRSGRVDALLDAYGMGVEDIVNAACALCES